MRKSTISNRRMKLKLRKLRDFEIAMEIMRNKDSFRNARRIVEEATMVSGGDHA